MKGFEAVFSNLKSIPDDMEKAALEVAQEVAPKMEWYAKKNRKWTDRTGHARQGLVGKFQYAKRMYVGCRIYSIIDYAYWLEVIQGGRFAILEETRNFFAEEFFNGISARLKVKRKMV
jgi:hypothetical protein